MDLGLGIGALVFLYILYVLLIKGLLWKLIFVIVGWAAIYAYLSSLVTFQASPFKSDIVSWAFIVPTVLVMLVLAHTKEE
jgi:type VI protein secretion system component VasK